LAGKSRAQLSGNSLSDATVQYFFDEDARKFDSDRWTSGADARHDFEATINALGRSLAASREGAASAGPILDLGSGTGTLMRQAALAFPDLLSATRFSVDFSWNMLARCNPAGGGGHLESLPVLASMDSLPFQSSSFSIVILSHVLEYSRRLDLVLAEVDRVMAPRGTLIVITKNRRALGWRCFKWMTELVRLNPVPPQYWRTAKEIQVATGFEILDSFTVENRIPTRANSVNDAFRGELTHEWRTAVALRMSKCLATSVFVGPLFRRWFGWHVAVVLLKPIRP
jgi:ubiquinone/menaquinone biosynthesis C-methylase UbiE